MPFFPNLPSDHRLARAAFIMMAGAALIWTVILGGSLTWNLLEEDRLDAENARLVARTAFEKDVLYRSWNSSFGGVYVPVSPTLQPNPYLNGYPRQNLTSVDGHTP
jgi:hypothetical protein